MADDAPPPDVSLRTRLAHVGCTPDESGAVVSPIHLATTFEREPDLSWRGHVYGRMQNPTRSELERSFARLEAGDDAAAFASGMAAITAVLASLPKGAVILPKDVYHGTRNLIHGHFAAWGLRIVDVDFRDTGALEAAVEDAVREGGEDADVVVFIETPSNPMLQVTPIKATCELVHRHGALAVVDSTWLTPVLCRPLELGADLVIHSTTKAVGGHSDMTGGMAVGPSADVSAKGAALFQRVKKWQVAAGGIANPFDCFLAMRGLRTLAIRVPVACDTALALAEFLDGHDGIDLVCYPGLSSHANHAVAVEEYGGKFGAMLSVRVRGGPDRAVAVAAALKVFRRATSLGGTESLVEHRASVEGPTSATPKDLLRLSIGLEAPEDLIEDWKQALAATTE